MFGLLKFLFYTFVAVVVGVVIGTVPVGGRTLAERIAAAYRGSEPGLSTEAPARKVPPKTAARSTSRAKVQVPAPPAPAPMTRAPAATAIAPAAVVPHGPVTAGAANTPDGHSDADQSALDRLIASKGRK